MKNKVIPFTIILCFLFTTFNTLEKYPVNSYALNETTNDTFFFDVVLLVPGDSDSGRTTVVYEIATELEEIGINASISYLTLNQIIQRTFENQEEKVNLTENGGYDIYFIAIFSEEKWSFLDFGYMGVNPLSRESVSIGTEWNLNHFNYENSTYFDLLGNYYLERNATKRMEIFQSMQEILYDDIPSVGLYSPQILVSHNPNLDSSLDEIVSFYRQRTPSLVANLGLNDSQDTLNILIDDTDVHIIDSRGYNPLSEFDQIQQLVYQPLYENTPGQLNSWDPLLAQTMPVWNDNYTEAIIKLRDDAYFSDGELFDAQDVYNTYQWFLNSTTFVSESFQVESKTFQHYFNQTDSIQIINSTAVKFIFSEPTIHSMNLFNVGILPSHIFPRSNFTYGDDIGFLIWNDLLANGSSPLVVGTGPYSLSSMNYNDTTLTLEFNSVSSYWNGPVRTSKINFVHVPNYLITDFITSERLDLVITRYPFDIETLNGNTNYENYLISETSVQYMGFNMQHPIFGNGTLTPLGLENPNKASEAARFVRKAINFAIPREKIVNTILDGWNYQYGQSEQRSLSIMNNVIGLNESVQFEYDLDMAKSFMERAGYVYPDANSQTQPIEVTSEDTQAIISEKIYFYTLIMTTLVFRKYQQKYKNGGGKK